MALRNKPLTEQVALLTGGGSGIGRAFAGVLAESGARAVVIASRREDVLRQTADELNARMGAERVYPYAFDIRDLARPRSHTRRHQPVRTIAVSHRRSDGQLCLLKADGR